VIPGIVASAGPSPDAGARQRWRALVVAGLAGLVGAIGAGALFPPLVDARSSPKPVVGLLVELGLLSAAALAVALWRTARWSSGAAGLERRAFAIFAGAFYLVLAFSLRWYVDDDAGITFSYARNLARGLGLVFQPGDPPVEGFSNPVWTVLLALAHLARIGIVPAAKGLGAASGLGALLLMMRSLRDQPPLARLAILVAASNAAFAVWSNSGLETGLHALLLMSAVVATQLALERSDRTATLALVLGLLVLSRPEGILLALAPVAVLFWYSSPARRRSWRVVAVAATPIAVLGALELFRWLYFHDYVPNTFRAKVAPGGLLSLFHPSAWRYSLAAARAAGWLWLIVPTALIVGQPKRWSPAIATAIGIAAAQLLFVASVRGDWMSEFRFIAPVVPVVGVVMGAGLGELSRWLSGRPRWWLLTPLLVGLSIWIATSQVGRLIRFSYQPTTPLAAVAEIGNRFKQIAAAAGIPNPSLLDHDAGGTSFVAEIRLIDLAGLTDRTLALHARDREVLRRYLFATVKPTFIYSADYFANRVGLRDFPEFEADYVELPRSANIKGSIRRVRRDFYPAVLAALGP